MEMCTSGTRWGFWLPAHPWLGPGGRHKHGNETSCWAERLASGTAVAGTQGWGRRHGNRTKNGQRRVSARLPDLNPQTPSCSNARSSDCLPCCAEPHPPRHEPRPLHHAPQVTTSINNLILGKIYIDHGGIMKARAGRAPPVSPLQLQPHPCPARTRAAPEPLPARMAPPAPIHPPTCRPTPPPPFPQTQPHKPLTHSPPLPCGPPFRCGASTPAWRPSCGSRRRGSSLTRIRARWAHAATWGNSTCLQHR